METKKRPGSERVKPDIGRYLAIERARQGAFSSHPKGKALPTLRFVKALDRGFNPALRPFPSAAFGNALSRLSLVVGLGPHR